MKSKTNQTNNKMKKRLLGTLAVLGIVGIGTIVATQAKRNILDSTRPFAEKSEFKILEIVPTNQNDANEEIGYFVSDQKDKADFKDVSKAKSLGGRSETNVNAPAYNQELQNFLKMREYGLVKYEGVDRGVYNVDVSEYPVYSQKASFVKRATEGYRLLEDQFVLGRYENAPNANGSYFLKEGYSISENGLIYKESQVEVEVPVDPGVSGNTVSGGDLPQQEPQQESQTTMVTVYEPIAIGNPEDKQLPEALEQRYDSDGELLMNGNANFVQDESGVYYGFTMDAFYVYEKPDAENNAFRNGDWFKEYVLGDRASEQNVIVETIAANAVTKEMLGTAGNEKYDLIYVSGSYAAYQDSSVDLSEDAVIALYNLATLPDYQAIMMDYQLLGSNSSSTPNNIQKLALLLWQKDQRAILSVNTDGLSADDKFTVSGELVTKLPKTTSTTWSVLGASMSDTPGMSTGNFVAGSVYVYEHKREYFVSSKTQIDAVDFFANGDFASEYTTGVVATGLTPVRIAVQMNNINHVDKKVAEAITPAIVIQYILSYDGTNPSLVKTELSILEIQPVRAFRYNSYWGTSAYEDCEPKIKEKRDQFIDDFLDDKFADNPSLVSFTSMTIEEFIGRNDDINEKYDMIYIGSEIKHKLIKTGTTNQYNDEIKYYYTTTGKTQKISYDSQGNVSRTNTNGELTDFNDWQNMCGMVYYNIGDIIYVGTYKNNTLDSLLGILEDGSEYGNTSYNSNKGKSRARFAGRDLTNNKLKAMKEFLDAGYPVIVAGDIVSSVPTGTTSSSSSLMKEINPTKVSGGTNERYDHGRVDNSSKLYEFLEYAIYGEAVTQDGTVTYSGSKPNLISEGDVKAGLVDKEDISEYLNKPKLSVNLTSRPAEYSYSTTDVTVGTGNNRRNEAVIANQTQLSPDPATGKCSLDYEFTITNAGALAEGGTYNVHLYIDVNADGKFSEQEELKDCTVTNAVTGAEIQPVNTIDGKSYSLQADVLYKLHRQVPEGYNGILPWNLEIVMENNIFVRASEQGYALVPRAGQEKTKIKILQINNNSTTLELDKQLQNAYSGNNYFGLYLKELKDYDVEVITVKQSDFQKSNHAYGYTKIEANKFNMLILGFGDCYAAFTETRAVDAIIDFIEAGKPVLLTHDLVMFRAGAPQTKMLRNYVGMDRYGCYDESEDLMINGKSVLNYILKNNSPISYYTRSDDNLIFQKIERAGHRVVYGPGSNKERIDTATQGISNLTMVRYRKGQDASHDDMNNYKKRYIAGHNGIQSLGIGQWKDQKEYMVHNINEGQITTYPYILPDSFNIATTHNQYYQLDMEGDMDHDGESDIVVWYTLGNKYNGSSAENPDFSGDGSEYTYTPNDVVNGYYIYNKGNVTYSGVGHSTPGSTASHKYEAQLFVNTMIAAYRAGTRPPKISFYESDRPDASEIVSLPVVYDKNVGKNVESGVDAESSVLRLEDGTFKNEFVDSGAQSTKLYFELQDENLVKGTKGIKLNFYVENPDGTEEITVDGTPVKVTKVPLVVHNSDFTHAYTSHVMTASGVVDCDADEDCMLQPATRYAIELPLSKLKDQGELKLYVEAETTIYNKTVSNSIVTQNSTKTIEAFSVIKMDLLDLD